MQNPAVDALSSLVARLRRWPSFLWRWEAQFKGVIFHGHVDIVGRPLVSLAKGGTIEVGQGVRIYSSTRANPLGLSRPCVLRALTPSARLVLADSVGLSGAVLCAGNSIEIGEKTIIGAGAMLFDNDFHRRIGEWDWSDDCQTGSRPIKVGRGVFVGTQAIILKGVTIGDRAVVGAGAVVTKDVPPLHLAIGNPARVVEPKQSHRCE
jgi:acetyltransferase-like isoleucine patch superfamily enzyme